MRDEEQFQRYLTKKLEEKFGGFVFRIKDVPATGIRYADIIAVINGHVVGIECKISKVSNVETLLSAKQGTYATAGQMLSNHLFQKANTIYTYAVFHQQSGSYWFLFYKSGSVYNAETERELRPAVRMSPIEFYSILEKLRNEDVTPYSLIWGKENTDSQEDKGEQSAKKTD